MILSCYTKKIELARKLDSCLASMEGEIEFVCHEDIDIFLLHLYYDMPEYTIIDLDDANVAKSNLLQELASDVWLQNIGVFGVQQESGENLDSSTPIFTILTYVDLERTLPKLLTVFNKYQNLLFRSGIFHDLSKKGTFVIENDPIYMQAYSEILANSLYKRNLIGTEKKYSLNFALVEMLVNAVEHGNCGISAEEKQKCLEEGRAIHELIEERNRDPEIARKKVWLEYEFSITKAIFKIRDEGEGFDISKIYDKKNLEQGMSGRGILFTKHMMESMSYNEKGNEVTFTIDYDQTSTSNIPQGLENSQTIDVKAGDVLFREGDSSNTLYYIVSGEFEVSTKKNVVNILNSSDIFLGEMAYLLGNRRTATATALTDGSVIAIEVHEWVDVVKKYPYYAVFLAKLLAKKLDKLSNSVASTIVG